MQTNGHAPAHAIDSANTLAEVEQAIDTLKAPAPQSETEATLQWLIRVSKESSKAVWQQHFDSILHVVLELVRDPEPAVREQTMRVLREMLKNQVRARRWPPLPSSLFCRSLKRPTCLFPRAAHIFPGLL